MLHAAALFYFREVARVGSIRKAAATLNVAASALNRQIINLEIKLGTPLFDRLPGSMRLTVAGDLLLRHVVDTLHDFDRVRGAIDDLKAARSGHIAVAALDSLLVDFLPRVVDRFRVDFPAVTYSVMTAQPPEVPTMVARGEIDMGFTFVGQIPNSVRYLTDIAAPIGVVMRADHPLGQQARGRFRRGQPLSGADPIGTVAEGRRCRRRLRQLQEPDQAEAAIQFDPDAQARDHAEHGRVILHAARLPA